jgi:hypothetical protein
VVPGRSVRVHWEGGVPTASVVQLPFAI